MTAVTIKFRARLDPDRKAAVLETLAEVARLSREEPDCLGYAIFVSDTDPQTIAIFQDWRSLESYEKHTRMPYVVDLFAKHEDYLVEPLQRTILKPVAERISF